ncbi:phytanoyl-CoA dioxygenase PhyH [Kribbella voronezhensis]|uniref:Phytanoyl-CoA dioxygenase PhyH n=1 Tax=Kribbella voronezhensis TaxID=2512212 RepID=A0A4R7SYK1_9ACTN|nr:phytanoyl-CoA dioxygenase family protein [Kribbella voronezhensis]TDU83999.1 phytanoyl-CoA dioxygenase PhyH [Kribbella voronezhensis]
MEETTSLVERYREDGFVVVDGLLPQAIVDQARHGVSRHHAGERDVELPNGLGYLDWRPGDPPGIRVNDYVSLQNEDVHTLVAFPQLAAMAAVLSESPNIRLFHDQIIYKDPAVAIHSAEVTEIGFHTDRAYWQTCSSDQMLTAWVPLTPCSEETGALSFVRGSHRWPGNDNLANFFAPAHGAALREVIAPSGVVPEVVTLELEPGQVSFHHCRTIHGSAPNRSQAARCAITVHFQDAANDYVLPPPGRHSVHVNDLLSRKRLDGTPDYADTFVSPILFEGTAAEAVQLIGLDSA